jgi:hypothetical protein
LYHRLSAPHCIQMTEIIVKRDSLAECAQLLDMASPDFSSLDLTAKDLSQHKSKWDLLGAFRADRLAWMTQPVCFWTYLQWLVVPCRQSRATGCL